LSLDAIGPLREKYNKLETDALRKLKILLAVLILPYLAVIIYNWTIFFMLKYNYWGDLKKIKLSKIPLILKKIGMI
jgi:hypothetical protein